MGETSELRKRVELLVSVHPHASKEAIASDILTLCCEAARKAIDKLTGGAENAWGRGAKDAADSVDKVLR